jgi:hypothetical protein
MAKAYRLGEKLSELNKRKVIPKKFLQIRFNEFYKYYTNMITRDRKNEVLVGTLLQ